MNKVVEDLSNSSFQEVNPDGELINLLSNPEFLVDDNVDEERYSLSLANELITPEIQFVINELFVQQCNGWSNATIQTLDARKATAKNWKYSLVRLGVWWSIHYPNTPLSQFTEIEVKELLVDAVANNIEWKKGLDFGPVSRGTLESLYLILNRSRGWKLKGAISDGLSFDLPKKFLETSIEEKLSEFGLTYHEWQLGSSWESIPLPVAMSLLGDAINIIRDTKTKFLIDFYTFMRVKESISIKKVFDKGFYDAYRLNKKKRPVKASISKVQKLKKIVLKHFPKSKGKFPFESNKEMVEYCKQAYDSCVVAFLCLTGIRISELASICADDYKKQTDGTWTFKSELIKTQFGIPEVREMSGLAAEAAELLSQISYIQKKDRADKKRVPLFTRLFYFTDYNKDGNFSIENKAISKGSLRHRLNLFYSDFLSAHPEFKELCEAVHPHRFRHTWAEFAIRRFDGNVLEAIRAHFRHAYGSRFTKHYVFNKLSDEVKEEIEKKYLKEILTNLALENLSIMSDPSFKRDLVGKLAKYISQAMGAEVVSIDEVDDFVEEISHEFESIVAHEYGFCIVRHETVSQSKCLDKETQTPKLQKACFEICSGCVHFLASKYSNEDNIIRIAVSHDKMINDHERIFGSSVKSEAINNSKKTLKEAEAILESMEGKV